MELFKVKRKPGESVKDCSRCMYSTETGYYHDLIYKWRGQWLNMIQVKDGLICEHFNRKG